jgi:hypothetical protein
MKGRYEAMKLGSKRGRLAEELDEVSPQFSSRDPARMHAIRELWENGKKTKEIASLVRLSDSWVRAIIKTFKDELQLQASVQGAESEKKWFERHCSNFSEFDSIIAKRTRGNRIWTTNLADSKAVRDITKKELSRHTLQSVDFLTSPASLKRAQTWMSDNINGSKKNFHGFIILPDEVDPDNVKSDLHSRLSCLLDHPDFQKCFEPIFQDLQSANNPAGDEMRLQAKMGDLIEEAEARVTAAEKALKGRKTDKTEREDDLKQKKADLKLLRDAVLEMCGNYERTGKVRPCRS